MSGRGDEEKQHNLVSVQLIVFLLLLWSTVCVLFFLTRTVRSLSCHQSPYVTLSHCHIHRLFNSGASQNCPIFTYPHIQSPVVPYRASGNPMFALAIGSHTVNHARSLPNLCRALQEGDVSCTRRRALSTSGWYCACSCEHSAIRALTLLVQHRYTPHPTRTMCKQG